MTGERVPRLEATAATAMSQPSPYQILKVGRDASDRDIKKAFKKAALRYHPDKAAANDQAAAADKFTAARAAFDLLSDKNRRYRLDADLYRAARQRDTSAPAPPSTSTRTRTHTSRPGASGAQHYDWSAATASFRGEGAGAATTSSSTSSPFTAAAGPQPQPTKRHRRPAGVAARWGQECGNCVDCRGKSTGCTSTITARKRDRAAQFTEMMRGAPVTFGGKAKQKKGKKKKHHGRG